MAATWTIVVPMKGFAQAKTRFGDVDSRGEFAQAFAEDLLTALIGCELIREVIVVTGDETVRSIAAQHGAATHPDRGQGLNSAIADAAQGHRPVAVFLGDLPCVQPADITWALTEAHRHDRSFITDVTGVGTTFLATTSSPLQPEFGEHSAASHAASGAHRIQGASPALHRDVDTGVDLWDAVRIGVGRATRHALQQQPG